MLTEKESEHKIPSGLAIEVAKQLERNQKRDACNSADEAFEAMAAKFSGLPKNGINYNDGELSSDDARALLQNILSGSYLPTNDIELALLSAILEREDGTHDPLWVRWLCGLMPSTYNP